MTDEMKLLPCPFCGGESHIGTVRYNSAAVRNLELEQDTFFKVNCVKCGANNLGVGGYATEADAAEAWNARATPSSPGDGWEPIETAPRDGRFFLACRMPDELEKGWHKSWEQWKAPQTVCWRGFHVNAPGKACWRDAKGSPVNPTHWRPLPAAPSPGGDQ